MSELRVNTQFHLAAQSTLSDVTDKEEPMKSILSASVCAATLLIGASAMAETTKHHHKGKHAAMHEGKGYKTAIDPTTASLNDKSLATAKGGAAPDTAAPAATPAASPAAPEATSGMTGTTTPSNAPQQ